MREPVVNVGGDASGFVAGEQIRRRATAGVLLEVHVGERLAVVVLDDEAGGVCLVINAAGAVWRAETLRYDTFAAERLLGRRLESRRNLNPRRW